jgi:hypothetical protein
MKKSTITALTIGVLGLGALGVWWGMHRDTDVAAPPAAVASPATDTATPARVTAPRMAVKKHTDKTTIAPDVVAALPATQPELHERLKPVLNRGTRMDAAAQGFRDAEQFAAVAHAARNTGVPFAVLKHRVLEQDQTLARAIRESKPELDAEHEATRARNAARFDIAVITG